MEQNTKKFQPAKRQTSSVNNKSILILMSLITVCGIATGVAGVAFGIKFKSQKQLLESKTQTKQIVEKVKSKKKKIKNQLDNKKIAEPVSVDNHILIQEWGVKIKIPDDLMSVSYEFSHQAGFQKLCASGVKKGSQYFPDFANSTKNNNYLGCIMRFPKDFASVPGGDGQDVLAELSKMPPVFRQDQYNFIYRSPQAVFSPDPEEAKLEVESVRLIREMFNKNISKL